MTEPTVTQADIDAAAAYWGNDNPPLELRAAFARHRTASAPAGEVEPVAWMHKHPFLGLDPNIERLTEGDKADGWTETPLYAHPPAPADLVEALRNCLAAGLPEEVAFAARAALAKHGRCVMADKINLLIAAAAFGYASYALAIGVGIPRWVNWTSREVPTDAWDIGLLVFAAVVLLGWKP